MTESIVFDTPENIQVRYRPAGLGTRFIAWMIDQTFALVLEIILLVVALFTLGFVSGFRFDPSSQSEAIAYVVGLGFLIFGLGNLLYFTLFELFMRGQTPGKRLCRLQVVKDDGFGLDAGGIVVRNVFRLVDSLPLTWIVPLLSRKSQRLGDMVAGTLVVAEERAEFSRARVIVEQRSAAEAVFRFPTTGLARLPRADVGAVEQLLDRWDQMPPAQSTALADRLATLLAHRLSVEAPPAGAEHDFLLDLLAADIRRRDRGLG